MQSLRFLDWTIIIRVAEDQYRTAASDPSCGTVNCASDSRLILKLVPTMEICCDEGSRPEARTVFSDDSVNERRERCFFPFTLDDTGDLHNRLTTGGSRLAYRRLGNIAIKFWMHLVLLKQFAGCVQVLPEQ